ncbi:MULTISPECIES: ABA4-like family protein [unclassified Novosphingobium]|uniref:ABA4-like family protein n=1 Tax=unclassified Novosphingobium TaxID=2644732 RepID=UPI0025F74311|nr:MULTISPECIES: ABA4-like family protein [unclassified Novosphingobium]HQV04027.1 ABA4-like family protein [Novosphingobium sp.]
MWDSLFSFTNGLAMVAWVLLLVFPRKPLTHSAILYLGVGLLCLIYTVCFALFVTGQVEPGGMAAAGRLDLTSIEGVRQFFLSDGGLVIGWTHYLAFDLFTGLWIARDADAKQFPRLVQAPFLLMTFLVGPVGLLAWLVLRKPAARRLGRG